MPASHGSPIQAQHEHHTVCGEIQLLEEQLLPAGRNGLFKTPEFEGDYSGQAPYSDTEDEEDNGTTEEEAEDGENATEGENEGETMEDTGDNDVSGDRDNVGEYSDPENMTDGIERGGESGEESDSESNFGDDGEE